MESNGTLIAAENKQEGIEMPICPNPDCLSRDLVRFGTYDGRQRWRCKECGTTTLYPRYRMPKKKRAKPKKKSR